MNAFNAFLACFVAIAYFTWLTWMLAPLPDYMRDVQDRRTAIAAAATIGAVVGGLIVRAAS